MFGARGDWRDFYREKQTQLMGSILAILLFVLPLGTSGFSIALCLFILYMASAVRFYRNILQEITRTSWFIVMILLLLWIVLSTCWSSAAPADMLATCKHNAKLLTMPLLVAAFSAPVVRIWGLRAFLAGMILCAILVFLQGFHVLQIGRNGSTGSLFRNYIMLGHMMAFASYLSLWCSVRTVLFRARMVYLFLFILFSLEILFFSESRTGYVLYLGLLLLFLVQHTRWQYCLLGMLGLCVLVVGVFYTSAIFRKGYESVLSDMAQYRVGTKNTSLGDRLQFHIFAQKLWLERPWTGQGSAGFLHRFEQDDPVPTWEQSRLLEPHSQYWLLTSEQGIIGITLFLVFIGSLVRTLWHLPTMTTLGFAVLLPFMLGNLSDSLLYYSGSGYFFIVMISLCLGEGVRSRQKK